MMAHPRLELLSMLLSRQCCVFIVACIMVLIILPYNNLTDSVTVLPSFQQTSLKAYDIRRRVREQAILMKTTTTSMLFISTDTTINADDELSQFYHQDRREKGMKFLSPISDPIGLAKLLEVRYNAYNSVRGKRRNSTATTNTTTNYIELSQIDKQLLQQYNVVVYNHPPIWSRLGKHSIPNQIKIQQVQKQHSILQQLYGPTKHPYQHVSGNMDGSFNTCYDCDLSITEIHSLLSQYTYYRQKCVPTATTKNTINSATNCNYCEMASAILLELNMHGVRISDTTYQWTTDPMYHFNESINSSMNSSTTISTDSKSEVHLFKQSIHPYTRDPLSRDWTGNSRLGHYTESNTARNFNGNSGQTKSWMIDLQIEQLLKERYEAIHREEYDLASWITYELYCTYEVGINDITQSWSRGCQFSSINDTFWTIPEPPLPPEADPIQYTNVRFPSNILFQDESVSTLKSTTRYTEYVHPSQPPLNNISSVSVVVPLHIHQRIHTLIQSRIQKREEGKFLEGDTIRNVLWHTYNIGINDRLMQYSFGGVFDEDRDTSSR